MTNMDAQAAGLSDLETALDTYGADRTRWPVPMRHALSSLLASSGQAQKILADAMLFDRLLDQAPAHDAARLGPLAERIVAAAERQPRIMPLGEVIPAQASPRAVPRAPLRGHGWAGAALAASLMLGIVAGQTKFIDPAAQLLMGTDNSVSSTPQLAQLDDADVTLDEDSL